MNTEEAARMLDDLRVIAENLHPRVVKLAKSGKPFIVIGAHEPYYLDAYRMIRKQEQKQGTWTAEDERCFGLATRAHREYQALLAAGRAVGLAPTPPGW